MKEEIGLEIIKRLCCSNDIRRTYLDPSWNLEIVFSTENILQIILVPKPIIGNSLAETYLKIKVY